MPLDLRLRIADESGAGRRAFRDMDRAAADDCAAARAGSQFCQGHSYRHITHPVPGCSFTGLMWITNPAAAFELSRQMPKIRLSASTLTMM